MKTILLNERMYKRVISLFGGYTLGEHENLNTDLDDFYTAKLGLKKGNWEDIAPSNHPSELADEFYELINHAYKSIGGHAKIKSPSDVFGGGWDSWEIVDVDDDPYADIVIFGKSTPHGVKSSGVGHDGSSKAKRAYLSKKVNDLKAGDGYAEVSGKLADILLNKNNVPTIDDEQKVRKILNKDIKWHGKHPTDKKIGGSGWYSRMIGGKMYPKILVGNM